jgi:hypothetical protein
MTTKMTYIRNEAGEFVCPTCGETKKNQNTMFYHMKRHTGELSHACDLCDKRFLQKSGLDQHRLQAHPAADATMWSCPLCDHVCRVKANMLIHIGRKHGKDWIPPMSVDGCCTGCERSFASVTAYCYHAVGCFKAPEDLAASLAAFATG